MLGITVLLVYMLTVQTNIYVYMAQSQNGHLLVILTNESCFISVI